MKVASIVLASNSPRRRQLLALAGWDFMVSPADVDERVLPGEPPREYVLRLAQTKARAVFAQGGWPAGVLVLAADTTVVDGDEILGKPADAGAAEAMLRRLRGRSHQVYTGLVVLAETGRLLSDVCQSEVIMRDYSEAEMLAYIASGDPLDKAGAYAIQHAGFRPVERLKGCYANVMGLPVCYAVRLLADFGVYSRTDVVQSCQQALETPCSVYDRVTGAAR